MQKATILNILVEPINDREPDNVYYVYTKMESVMKSCDTIKQLNQAWHWARCTFDDRFPDYEELWWKLHSVYDTYFDIVFDKMQEKLNEDIEKLSVKKGE